MSGIHRCSLPSTPWLGPIVAVSIIRARARIVDEFGQFGNFIGAYQRDTFLTHYHRRSNVECTFSMVKRKFGSSLRSKSYEGQVNEVLAKVICHNLAVLISAIHEMGLEMPQFAA